MENTTLPGIKHFLVLTYANGCSLANDCKYIDVILSVIGLYSVIFIFRMWFPCIDSYNELCTWKIEVTVEAMMVAITAGELIDTVTSSDGKEKTYVYELNVPTSACNIALAVG